MSPPVLRRMVILLMAIAGMARCGGSGPAPTAPSTSTPPPPAAIRLAVFRDPTSTFSTSDESDVHEQIVRFDSAANSLIWAADGRSFSGYPVDGNFVRADRNFQVRFGTKDGEPPDGQAIAFDCEVDAGNRDICTVRADGTGLVRLTTDPTWDSGPAYSPDGLTIAFATALPFANPRIVVMNADGTGVSQGGAVGSQPAWSPDGTRIAYVVPFEGACDAGGGICLDTIYTSNVDGTDPRVFASGNRPAWGSSAQPVALFLIWRGCNGLVCDFDGTRSWGGDGGIPSYAWNFGDGTTESGPAVSHAYSASGTYKSVSL